MQSVKTAIFANGKTVRFHRKPLGAADERNIKTHQ